MGGWMTYGRFRNHRSGLAWRPDDEQWPYPHPDVVAAHEPWSPSWYALVGDLNRMERDYLAPVYPEPPFALRPPGSSPAEECSAATGVDVETVRRVLTHVFRDSR